MTESDKKLPSEGSVTDEVSEQSTREQIKAGLSEAARNAGIGKVAPGEVPTASSLLAAVGGVRGLIESIIPGLGFLVTYAITNELLASVLVPIAVAVLFVIARAIGRTTTTPAVAGLIGIAFSAAIALMTGNAADNFVPGLIINVASIVVLLASLIARWPLVGLIVGLLTNELTEWRQDAAKRRVLTVATWLWVGMFSARLLVQAPLYFSNQVEILAATKLLMGVPLYAAMLWLTWLLVRSVYAKAAEAPDEAAESAA